MLLLFLVFVAPPPTLYAKDAHKVPSLGRGRDEPLQQKKARASGPNEELIC